LFYVGDKYKLLSQILPLFPAKIDRFIEPFAGGGSVAMNVTASQHYLNDIDENIVGIHKLLESYASSPGDFFKKAKEYIDRYGLSRSYFADIIPPELKAEWKKTYYAKFNTASYRKLREDYNLEGKTDVLKLYLLLIYGFNRMIRFNKSGLFNLPVGNVDFNANVVSSLESYFNWARLTEPEWSSLDFRKFMAGFTVNPDDFTYFDPPYLITFSEYNKLWNENTEHDLLALLDNLNAQDAKFAISNVTHYKGRTNNAFIEWAKKYVSYNVRSNYISYHDNSIKQFQEVLVTNYHV
jgi:DNA adenine methylase